MFFVGDVVNLLDHHKGKSIKTLTITDAALGKCEWAPLTGEMSVPGVYACRLAITKTNPNGYVELPVEEFRID